MEGQFWNVALYGSLAGFATLGGIYIVLTREAWARRGSIYLIRSHPGNPAPVQPLQRPPGHQRDGASVCVEAGAIVFDKPVDMLYNWQPTT